jgi:HEAT repeat protein
MRRLLLLSLTLLPTGCASPSTEEWLGRLKDPDVMKRRQAIRELGPRAAEARRVVPALVEALRDESSYVRRDAALALGKFEAQAREAVPGLVAALKDKEKAVREAARASLKKIDLQAAGKAGVR